MLILKTLSLKGFYNVELLVLVLLPEWPLLLHFDWYLSFLDMQHNYLQQGLLV